MNLVLKYLCLRDVHPELPKFRIATDAFIKGITKKHPNLTLGSDYAICIEISGSHYFLVPEAAARTFSQPKPSTIEELLDNLNEPKDLSNSNSIKGKEALLVELTNKVKGSLPKTTTPPKTLKPYEVWMEGYAATGDQGKAIQLSNISNKKWFARNFKEACQIALRILNWDMEYYDENHNTYWGCKFYNNEADARKSFG